MNLILNRLKNENDNEIENYGSGFFLFPLDIESRNRLAMKAQTLLQVRLANEYLDLLELTDGFSVNGFNLYGSTDKDADYFLPGIITANLEFWQEESLRDYIAYADENSSRLVFNLKTKSYECLDNVTWEQIEEFETFYDALTYILDESNIIDC